MSSLNYQRIAEMPDAFQLFKPSWAAFKLNLKAFLIAVLVPLAAILLAVTAVIGSAFKHDLDTNSGASTHDLAWAIPSIILGFLAIVIILVFSVATSNYLKLQSAKGKRMGIKQAVKESLPFFWRLLGLTLWRGFLIIGGLILLIIPGIYLWKRYLLAPYYLMDENVDIFEAMKRSGADSSPFASALWGILGVIILIQLIGILPWIGWIISATAGLTYMCAGAVRYYQIKDIKLASVKK